jgi:replicative DNA helicase Mcm
MISDELKQNWKNMIFYMKTNKVFYRDEKTGALEFDLDNLNEYDPSLHIIFMDNSDELLEFTREELSTISKRKDFINFQILNLKRELVISRIRNIDSGKICKIRGIIKRITKPIIRSISIKYECCSCGTTVSRLQNTKKINLPTNCPCGNRNPKRFIEISSDKKDIQEMSIEEFPEETVGKQPQQIRVYIEGDLTEPDFSEKLYPGRRIEVVGVIRPMPPFMTRLDTQENVSEFMFCAININHLEEDDNIDISEEDIRKIKEISKNNPLNILAENLSKNVYGNTEIKKAIVLQLAKGVRKVRPDGTFTRGDINILLSGDPGQAKSVLLKATSLKSPNSRYVSGTRSSGVGLTASLKEDELLKTYVLEAGVIVLCSGSMVSIDELEKMDANQLSSLYEPLEVQTVTVSKAGINATLSAQTSILSACNPIKGKFDHKSPLASQIDLPSPLLNRFDLIFILLDEVDEKKDSEAVKHLFKLHSGQKVEEQKEEISLNLFKKYISYIRKFEPKIKPELEEYVDKLYRDIRRESSNQEGVPINLRNIEGLLRLAEASAKIRLSSFVELEDLKIAEQILRFTLKQLAYDENGKLDISRMTEKVPVTKRGRMEKIIQLIKEICDRDGKCIFEVLKKEALDKDIQQWEINNFLEQLKREGVIYEPIKGEYKIL